MSVTSIGGTFIAVITASLLKPLLSANQSLQLPLAASYDQYNKVWPFEVADKGSDGVTDLFLTLHHSEASANNIDTDFGMKRQFDPWGGKRHMKSVPKDEDIGDKRQFSPWGGKRSFRVIYHPRNNGLADEDSLLDDLAVSKNKKSDFNSWSGKRSSNSWIGNRNSGLKDLKRRFNSWGSRKSFNSWGGKRYFNSWVGKRPEINPKINFHFSFSEPKINTNMNSKRQSFKAWGGKRSFNSWGGKRSSNSWGDKINFTSLDGKRIPDLEPE